MTTRKKFDLSTIKCPGDPSASSSNSTSTSSVTFSNDGMTTRKKYDLSTIKCPGDPSASSTTNSNITGSNNSTPTKTKYDLSTITCPGDPSTSSSTTSTNSNNSSFVIEEDKESTIIEDEASGMAVDHGVGSLPTVEEIRANGNIGKIQKATDDAKERRKQCMQTLNRVSGIILLVLTIVIPIIVVVSIRAKNENNTTSNSTTTNPFDFFDTRNDKNDTRSKPSKYYNMIADYLIGVSSVENLYPNATSRITYQQLAIDYLVQEMEQNTDSIQFLLNKAATGTTATLNISNHEEYLFVVRYIMILNYYTMGGARKKWKSQLSFTSFLPTCDWHGPNTHYETSGVICNNDVNPEILRLDYNGLTGTIPTENGMLYTLEGLNLNGNNLYGTIPTELCQLTNLETLQLSSNQLMGTIPECIYNMPKLQRIHFGTNKFSGSILMSLSNMNNTLLEFIVDHNQLTGDPMPAINQLNQLRTLALNNNNFTGIIDDNFLGQSLAIEYIDLSYNQFQLGLLKTLPQSLFSLMQLTTLNLGYNQLNGIMKPNVRSTENKLHTVSVRNNQLYGTIPIKFVNVHTIRQLDLSNNMFTGTIPTEYGYFTNLQHLSFANNNNVTSGAIPELYSNLSSLESLNLQNTNRNGTIPANLGPHMTNLTYLDLSDNDLSGRVPPSFGLLGNLKYLLLNSNPKLNGTIENDTIRNWTKIEVGAFDHTAIVSTGFGYSCQQSSYNYDTTNTVLQIDAVISLETLQPSCPCCKVCTNTPDDCSNYIHGIVDNYTEVTSSQVSFLG